MRSQLKKAAIAGGLTVLVLAVLAVTLATDRRFVAPEVEPEAGAPADSAESQATPDPAAEDDSQGFLFGRVAIDAGAIYEGRLRWGTGEEAFWSDFFNGSKKENSWISRVPPGRRPRELRPFEIFGFELFEREHPLDLGRPFMARFGDIARIEARGRVVRVTLKSGGACDLDRLEASDFDDGVRVWDTRRGIVDLDSLRIRSIEFLPTARLSDVPSRLRGIVRTRQGDFTGFVQWDREACVGSDELRGRTADGEVRLRFDSVRSIARRSDEGSLVTLRDGREMVLSASREAGHGSRGVYVDDPRYGRVLVSWGAFEQLDFDSLEIRGSGPAYADFPPGNPLSGTVTTMDGRRLAGRLVFDLDESETTETLDAPAEGVDYTIPFGLISSIALLDRQQAAAERAVVRLHSGEELQLERAGDLGARNAGLLIFVEGSERAEYVPWSEVSRIDLEEPSNSGRRARNRPLPVPPADAGRVAKSLE